MKYAQLLLLPLNLCAEYSYNCIPSVDSLDDPRMLVVLALDIGLLFVVKQVLKRPNSGSSIAWLVLIITFLPASNIFFRIGRSLELL